MYRTTGSKMYRTTGKLLVPSIVYNLGDWAPGGEVFLSK